MQQLIFKIWQEFSIIYFPKHTWRLPCDYVQSFESRDWHGARTGDWGVVTAQSLSFHPPDFAPAHTETAIQIYTCISQEVLFLAQEEQRQTPSCECGFLHKLLAAAKSLQSCLTLCDPTDGSPPGSPVPGILQARTLWVWVFTQTSS